MGSKSSPPPPPDYAAAATAQGAANVDAARTQGRINNPNVINPYGRQTVTWEGDTPTLTQTLSPQEQAVYDREVANRLGMGGLAQQGIQSAQGVIGRELDLSGAGVAPEVLRALATPQALDASSLPSLARLYGGASNLPELTSGEQLRQQAIEAVMSRGREDLAQKQEQLASDLEARGIPPGSKAYEREMQRLSQQENDLRLQAEQFAGGEASRLANIAGQQRGQLYGEQTTDAGLMFDQDAAVRNAALQAQGQQFQQQGQAGQFDMAQQNQRFGQQDANRRQAISEILAQRQVPLNEIIGLASGSQVSNPFSMPGYAQNSQVAPAPIFGAAQAQDAANMNRYQQQSANRNNMMSGLFSIGAAAAGRPSDMRLKSNIKRIRTDPKGFGWYEYDIFGRREIGVLAQEVRNYIPEAVAQHPLGYLVVDYGALNG